MKYLVVGLGNIGAEYEGTRHNAGFMVVDDFARRNGVFFSEQRYGATAEVSVKGRKIILLKPNTFMNLSGNAVRYWMQKENIQLENLLVIVDDLALPFGALRLKP
ncbi:MAG: peptidyl-tRNA hydrolase, partial [Paludibacteraceae bacterium]|nr:peptidyl-tRNA hydrolase [Paludibacteraceae bacterium]